MRTRIIREEKEVHKDQIKEDKGDTGPQGPQGLKGDKGDTGPQVPKDLKVTPVREDLRTIPDHKV